MRSMSTLDDDVAVAPPEPAPLPIGPRDVQSFRDRVVWGDRVRLERLLRRWSQLDLARVAGVTQPQVSRLERGAVQVSRATLTKIARAFALPTAELFPFDDALDEHERVPVDAHVPATRAS